MDKKEILKKLAQSPDQQFEQGFFQLAYDKLQSKLFNLLNYMVGFEVVNKNAEGTKAVGVFGFKSDNGQILFVPCFFINGKVKDLDVMYSRNNNQFYPLNEDFAEMFLKDDVTGMGSMSGQPRREIEKQSPPSDMRDLVMPPRTGRIAYASVIDFVADGDDQIKQAAWNLMQHNPEFTEALHRFYPLEEIGAALRPTEKIAAQSDVEVYTSPESAPKELKSKALSKGFVVVDRRPPEKKSRYGILDYPTKFTTANTPGFYLYLNQYGGLTYGLVLTPQSLRSSFGCDDNLVLPLTSEAGVFFVSKEKGVLVREQLQVEDFSAVHKQMIEPSRAEPNSNSRFILLNEQLHSSEPFFLDKNFVEPHRGLRRLVVSPARYLAAPIKHNDYSTLPKDKNCQVTLVFTKKVGNSLDVRNGIVYVPKGFKLLEVSRSRGCCDMLRPGTLKDLTANLQENGVYGFHLRSNGSEYFADAGKMSKKYDDPIKAKIGMVLDFGLDLEDAEELLAKVSEHKPVRGLLKKAVTGDFTHTLFDEPESYNELGQPTTYGIPYQAIAPNDHYYQGDPTQQGIATTTGPDQGGWASHEASSAAQLAASGQKQIFDTSAIATISKYVDPSHKVISYVPNFVDTLDKLGRMLFMVYWETDKFQKMYGSDELPELVELVKNVFRNLGDLVIFLKRKFPDLSINVSEQDLSDGG